MSDLLSALIDDGCPNRVDDDLADQLVTLAGQENAAGRASVLLVIWELTVDPRVPDALGTTGLAADRGVVEDDAARVNATANRRRFRSLIGALAVFLADDDTRVRDAAAAALSAHGEIAEVVGYHLAAAYRARQSAGMLLACAVLAGTARHPVEELVDLFRNALAASPSSALGVIAAIGLRNLAVPGPIPRAVADRLRAAVAAQPIIDLSPWQTRHDPLRTASSLLLDDLAAHTELLKDGLRNQGGDIRRRIVPEVWRSLCAWREHESTLVPLLVERLTDSVPEVAEAASSRMAFVPALDARAADRLAALAYESPASSPLTRANGILALATHGDARCLPAIRQALGRPRPGPLLGSALRGLGAHAPTLIPALRATFRRGVPADSATAVADILWAVATWPSIGEPWPEVVDLLADHRVRVPALELLGTVATLDLAVEIRPFLDDTVPAVRARAAWAYWRATGETAPSLRALRDMLSGTAVERREAATLIARFGPAAEELAPILTENRHQENRHTTIAISRALVAIGTPEWANPVALVDALRFPRDATETLRVLGRTPVPFGAVNETIQRIAHSRIRHTWPDISDTAVTRDIELQMLAQVRV